MAAATRHTDLTVWCNTWLAHLGSKWTEDLIASTCRYIQNPQHTSPRPQLQLLRSSLRTPVPSLSSAISSGLPAFPLAFLCPQLQSLSTRQKTELNQIHGHTMFLRPHHSRLKALRWISEWSHKLPMSHLLPHSLYAPAMTFSFKNVLPPKIFFLSFPCALKVVLQNICMIQSLAFLFLFQCYPSEASSAHVM